MNYNYMCQGCISKGAGEGQFPPPPVLADQLTLFSLGGADYARHITTGPTRFFGDAVSLCIIQGGRVCNLML
jgi:hypothetical protein